MAAGISFAPNRSAIIVASSESSAEPRNVREQRVEAIGSQELARLVFRFDHAVRVEEQDDTLLERERVLLEIAVERKVI